MENKNKTVNKNKSEMLKLIDYFEKVWINRYNFKLWNYLNKTINRMNKAAEGFNFSLIVF